MILDDPVYRLDPLASQTIQDFIKKRKETTVLATHSTHLVKHVADNMYFLMYRRIILYDSVPNLLNKHDRIENAYFYYKEKK